MSTDLISVILPMYRVAPVLPQCLDCLLAQSYRHLELIFVDDCSPDDSSILVEQHRARFEERGMQVRLVRHQENGGVASARTTALEVATGDWVYHYDADDRLAPDALERMIREANHSAADVVGMSWRLCHGERCRSMTQPSVSTGREAFFAMCRGILKWNLWLFLVRRDLIEGVEPLRFTPGNNMGEDMMLMGKVFLRAETISVIQEPLYDYIKNDQGQLTGKYTDAHWVQVDANLKDLEMYVQRLSDMELHQELNYLKLNLKLPLLISEDKADYQRWSSWLAEANIAIMDNPALPLRTRLLQLAADRGWWSLVRLYNRVVMQWLYGLLYK